MRVICINNKCLDKQFWPEGAPMLKEGEIYTVIQMVKDGWGQDGYILAEVKSQHPSGSFRADRFIPLSESEDKVEEVLSDMSFTMMKVKFAIGIYK